MIPKVVLKKIWFDDDVAEFTVVVSDGRSSFETDVYVGCNYIDELIRDLTVFKDQVFGGLYDIRMGEFGPEYASGAFHARLNFKPTGRLSISTSLQSEYFDFADRQVAAEAKMYLRTEPGLFDNFITQLKHIKSGIAEEAELVCA